MGGRGSYSSSYKDAVSSSDPRDNMSVQSIKQGLLWGTSYDAKYNSHEGSLTREMFVIASGTIDEVANANLGFASEVAKTSQRYGYSLSEKQAYVIANAAYENNIGLEGRKAERWYKDTSAEQEKQRISDENKRAAKKEEYNSTYKRSTTKVEVGSRVTDSKGRVGTISNIITRSSGYVQVRYDDGSVGKQMAFNLRGDDGNPLKKKPF